MFLKFLFFGIEYNAPNKIKIVGKEIITYPKKKSEFIKPYSSDLTSGKANKNRKITFPKYIDHANIRLFILLLKNTAKKVNTKIPTVKMFQSTFNEKKSEYTCKKPFIEFFHKSGENRNSAISIQW